MICCVVAALFMVNMIIFFRKIAYRLGLKLGLKKEEIDDEFRRDIS